MVRLAGREAARSVTVDGSVLPAAAVKAGLGEFVEDDDAKEHYRGITFHDLRHTFISHMARANVHVSVIAAMIGHKDGGALLPTGYRHLFSLEQKDAAAAFERLVRGGVAPGLQTGSEARP